MRCRNCGSENDDNLYICSNCGSPLYDEQEEITETEIKSRKPSKAVKDGNALSRKTSLGIILAVAIVAVCIAFAASAGFFSFDSGKTETSGITTEEQSEEETQENNYYTKKTTEKKKTTKKKETTKEKTTKASTTAEQTTTQQSTVTTEQAVTTTQPTTEQTTASTTQIQQESSDVDQEASNE